jgi:hypothetical protein
MFEHSVFREIIRFLRVSERKFIHKFLYVSGLRISFRKGHTPPTCLILTSVGTNFLSTKAGQ